MHQFRLYVAGVRPGTDRTISALQEALAQSLNGQYFLEVIDVLEEPRAAERDAILATPTVMKLLPPPLTRVVGDLSQSEKLLRGLGVQANDVC